MPINGSLQPNRHRFPAASLEAMENKMAADCAAIDAIEEDIRRRGTRWAARSIFALRNGLEEIEPVELPAVSFSAQHSS